MKREKLIEILEKLKDGRATVKETLNELRSLPYKDLGFAKIDEHRALRKDIPEAVLAEGKTIDQIVGIVREMRGRDTVMVTRADERTYEALGAEFEDARYFPEARMIVLGEPYEVRGRGYILIATGGTSDLPVAEEASVTAKYLGNEIEKMYDVGVAGVHRLLDHAEEIFGASVIIAIAGMEGSLPSVVSGIASAPVIGVPTSAGYGANLDGISALLSMLNSCAPGMAVVNIDDGYGAACLASMINRVDES